MFAQLDYTDLFKALAQRHKQILHTEQACHFVKVILSADPIQKQVQMSGFYDKLKLKIKPGPCLLLISYEADYEDAGDEKTLTHRHGSFMILEKAKLTDEHRDEVLDRAEHIAHEIMGAVLKAFRSPEARRQGRMLDRNNMALDSIGPVGDNYYGCRFDFMFTQPATAALAYNPDAFTE
jgi:hypothetical protein